MKKLRNKKAKNRLFIFLFLTAIMQISCKMCKNVTFLSFRRKTSIN